MDNKKIPITDNKFEIIRYEGFGDVKNICNYDKNIFKLEINYEPNGNEGGSCKTIYSFKIINKEKSTNSNKYLIEFIEDNFDHKYYTYYEYYSNLDNIMLIDNPSDKTNSKCIIL
jgi:hypothetical protein